MKSKTGISLVLMVILAISFSSFALIASAQPAERAPVIIGFREFQDADLVRAHGGVIKYTYEYILAIAASVPPQAVDALQSNPNVAYVETDFEVYALEQTTPWGIQKIRAPEVWATGNKGTGVKIAIIDTGIDIKHPDLKVVGGVSYVSYTTSYNDDNGHGTHCAGIVAALDNGIGVVGVSPEALLYAVKVLNSRGSGYLSDVNKGIEWSISNGMQVMSMSFGSTSDSTSLHAECDKAYNAGIVLVAAAGNNGPGENTITYPAKYSSVIAVGATDNNDVVASFSSRGTELSVTAPGVSIYSTYKGGTYATLSGTSMACPHAAGTVALILGKAAHTPAEVRDILQKTALDLGPAGWDSAYGYGRIDAYEVAPGVDTTPPTISNLTPADGALINTATPTISATVTDASGIAPTSIVMTVDTAQVIHTYDSATGLVSYVSAIPLAEGLHAVVLSVKDTVGNLATASWSFRIDITPPPQVTGLTVTTISESQLSLSWTATTEQELGHYNVYRSTTSGFTPSADNLIASPSTTSYSDTGLAPSTTYYYRVTAVDTSGNEGTPSEEASGTTLTPTTQTMHVSSIDMRYQKVGSNYKIYTKVTVVDTGNSPVSGATVYLTLTTPSGSMASASGVTGTDGTVTFVYGPTKTTGTYTSTITNVIKDATWTYDATTSVTTKSLTVP